MGSFTLERLLATFDVVASILHRPAYGEEFRAGYDLHRAPPCTDEPPFTIESNDTRGWIQIDRFTRFDDVVVGHTDIGNQAGTE